MKNLLTNMGTSVLYGLIGIIMMALGYIIFDKIIPADFNKELEKGNMAVGIVIAGLLIAIAIIAKA